VVARVRLAGAVAAVTILISPVVAGASTASADATAPGETRVIPCPPGSPALVIGPDDQTEVGTLEQMVHQYSNTSVDVAAIYSAFQGADASVVITVREGGAVIQQRSIPGVPSPLGDYAIGGLHLGHTYSFQSAMVWADGSHEPIVSNVDTVRLRWLSTITTTTATGVNCDIPSFSLGMHDTWSISTSTRTDPQAQIFPKAPKIRVAASASRARVTWTDAHRRGETAITGYKVVLTQGRHHQTKRLSPGARRITFHHLRRGTWSVVLVTPTDQAGNAGTTSTMFITKS
jgi:hypothetical protein